MIPHLVEQVYRKIFSFDMTKAVIMKCGEVAGEVNMDNDQMKKRMKFLGTYLHRVVTGENGSQFADYMGEVGNQHAAAPGHKAKTNVSYVHCNAMLGWLHAFLMGMMRFTKTSLPRTPNCRLTQNVEEGSW
jgi:Protoglobin